MRCDASASNQIQSIILLFLLLFLVPSPLEASVSLLSTNTIPSFEARVYTSCLILSCLVSFILSALNALYLVPLLTISLNLVCVQRPSRPLLSSGPVSYPMNRPIAAMWESETTSSSGASGQSGESVMRSSSDPPCFPRV